MPLLLAILTATLAMISLSAGALYRGIPHPSDAETSRGYMGLFVARFASRFLALLYWPAMVTTAGITIMFIAEVLSALAA